MILDMATDGTLEVAKESNTEGGRKKIKPLEVLWDELENVKMIGEIDSSNNLKFSSETSFIMGIDVFRGTR